MLSQELDLQQIGIWNDEERGLWFDYIFYRLDSSHDELGSYYIYILLYVYIHIHTERENNITLTRTKLNVVSDEIFSISLRWNIYI